MEEQTANQSNTSRTSADHSAALAEKLLQGWALLQEHCPQCLTPLVRNRQRRMYCVACDQWVVSQSEAAEQLARERVEKGAIGSTREIVPHPLPSPEPRPGHISGIHSREPEAGPTPLSRNGVDASNHEVGQNARREQVIGTIEQDSLQSQQRHNDTAFAIPKLDYSGRTLEQVIPQVSLILTHKLEEIGKALLETQDVHNIRLLLLAIQDCAQTMETLRGIH